MMAADIAALNERLAHASTEDVLRWAWERFGETAAIGTSFQGAGLVMIHIAHRQGFRFPLFTLDTGLLFPETAELRKRLEDFYSRNIEVLVPDLTVEQQAAAHGPELWAREPDLCCTVRKVLPLRAKLSTLSAWITGLRRQQSASRTDIGLVELHRLDGQESPSVVKINPMAAWNRDAVWAYLREHAIPYNPLHDQGYHSIGCWPCTRPTACGEDERAGRWTGFAKVECGIHTFMTREK